MRNAFLVTMLIILASCTITRPRLMDSGSYYHSVSDDIIIYTSATQAITEMGNALDPKLKYVLVQVLNNDLNDYLGDRIFEDLFARGYTVALTTKSDLEKSGLDSFDKYLLFYPTVYGTETAATTPTFWTNMVGFIPIVGWIAGPIAIARRTYDDRQAGVCLHARLVDVKSGNVDWIKDFAGQDRIRVQGGNLNDFVFPWMKN